MGNGKEVRKMKIAALEEKLKETSVEDLGELATALDVCTRKLPKQLVQEMALQLVETIVRLVLKEKKGG